MLEHSKPKGLKGRHDHPLDGLNGIGAYPPARWRTTLSSKVNLPSAIIFGPECGANLVFLTEHSRIWGRQNPLELNRVGRRPPLTKASRCRDLADPHLVWRTILKLICCTCGRAIPVIVHRFSTGRFDEMFS